MGNDRVAGVIVHRDRVHADWIDVNRHMNVAYYVLAFDHAVDRLWQRFGIDSEYIETRNDSTFAVECHVTWQRELCAGDEFFVTSQVLAFDAKRIHHFMRMYDADKARLAATAEWMNLHVDLDNRRVSAWPEAVTAAMADFAAGQGVEPLPDEAGSRMRVRSPLWRSAGYQ